MALWTFPIRTREGFHSATSESEIFNTVLLASTVRIALRIYTPCKTNSLKTNVHSKSYNLLTWHVSCFHKKQPGECQVPFLEELT